MDGMLNMAPQQKNVPSTMTSKHVIMPQGSIVLQSDILSDFKEGPMAPFTNMV